MNKKSIICITAILVCVFTTLGFNKKNGIVYGEDNITKYLNEQNEEMSIMMEDMKNIKPTGDVSLDFLYGMIPHHKAAIEMSNSLLKYGGQNEEIKKIAKNIITNQNKEIEQMKDMIKSIESNPQIDEKKEQDYLKKYNEMLTDNMNEKDKSKINSVDKAFAIGMIKHHEMAITMAQDILKYTNNQDVINLANNIIKSQNSEIVKMKEFVNSKEK